jgi:hypothetical protein
MKNREIIYIVALEGQHVWKGQTFKCFIKSFREFDEVREILKRDYKIEFEELANKFINGYYWMFENITDDRDIRCVVYSVEHYSTLP